MGYDGVYSESCVSYQVVFLANAGIHSFQDIGLHGCPIKNFGHDGNSYHEPL